MNTTLKKGDMILFFAGDTWLSKSISWLTNGEVTHASMVYSEDTIIEILSDGVQLNKIALCGEEGKGKKAYVMRHVPELDFAPLKKSADDYLNADVSYDFPGLYLLGGLLIYNKFVPSPRFLNCAELILEMGILQLDRFIQKQVQHKPGKAMVCSQFIYQLFYDCGGDYRIPIVDGCFSFKKTSNTCQQGEICLADLLVADASALTENGGLCGEDEADIELPCGISEKDLIERAARELYLTLTGGEDEGTKDTGMTEVNGLFSKQASLNRVQSLAGRFLEKVKEMRQRLGTDLPLDAMFVTVADLAHHAPSLERVDTVYVERIATE